MDNNCESNFFITLKDHKENFQGNPLVWLINLAKNEAGRLNKCIIETMNKDLRKVQYEFVEKYRRHHWLV